MATRRGFLVGLIATGLTPVPTWADAGNPSFLSAARTPEGNFVLAGLDDVGAIRFAIPLPTRGHAAAAHPHRPEAVAFARRPGVFALVLDCQTGEVLARLDSPEGRHFYGHGTFDPSGDLLFTTENDFEVGQGRIGIWDARRGYVRIGEITSHGVGPHDLRLMPDGSLVVANGGIDTHPASGREKLNIPTMQPNLCYLDLDGHCYEHVTPFHHHASVRHLSIRADGMVGVAMQWQGEVRTSPPLVATHMRGETMRELGAGLDLAGYVGSIDFSGDGTRLAVTSPRAGVAAVFDTTNGDLVLAMENDDVCGIAASKGGMMLTNGGGRVFEAHEDTTELAVHDLSWDNHLIAIPQGLS